MARGAGDRDAERPVATGLMRAAEPELRWMLHGQCVDIVNNHSGPAEMPRRSEAAAAELPDEVRFRCGVMVGLCRQGELQRA